MNKAVICASVLSADFGRLREQIQEAHQAGIDWIHVDIMDGSYVPQISFGARMVATVKEAAPECYCDAHLMVENPENHIPAVTEAGADLVSFHPESTRRAYQCLDAIRSGGAKTGYALSPAIPLSVATPVVKELDLLLAMTVEPGFGGQKMIAGMLDKVSQARKTLDEIGSQARLQVDGGVAPSSVGELAAAGADTFVAGSALFGAPDIKQALSALQSSLDG